MRERGGLRLLADAVGGQQRQDVPRGDVEPLSKVLPLARAWYGRHLDVDWKKWTIDEARAIFERLGLRGDSWQLPAAAGTF